MPNSKTCRGTVDSNQTVPDVLRHFQRTSLWQGDAVMPVESIMVSVGVVAMFAIFAGVLFWGDLQS
jgi:hypothetical protein